MVVLVWDERLAVGHPQLDADHRILIAILNQLQDAIETGQSRDVIGSVINVLAEFAEHHFTREERAMELAGFPGCEAHARIHRSIEAEVYSVRDRYRAGEQGALDEEALDLLRKWLTEHISVADKSYGPWMEKAEASGGRPGLDGYPRAGGRFRRRLPADEQGDGKPA